MNNSPDNNTASLHAFKLRLFAHCKRTLAERIDTALAAMDEAQHAANAEEKSSAGDKYETARGMAQLNKEMYAGQLQAHRAQLAKLNLVDAKPNYEFTRPGALIVAKGTMFFIATGLGKITFEGQVLFVLSADAPLSTSLLNKQVGDEVSFNGQVISILQIV